MQIEKILFIFIVFSLAFSAFALTQPTITSPSHPDSDKWYPLSYVSFQWNSIEGAKGYSYVIDKNPNTIPDDIIDTTDTSISKSVNSGIFYFHLKAISDSDSSSTAHFRFKVDSSFPPVPKNIKVSAKPAYMLIEWEQEPDEHSGISHYYLYRGYSLYFDIHDPGVKLITQTKEGEPIKGTSYQDYDIQENHGYFYKLKVFDNAGNSRITFLAKGAKAAGQCSNKPTISFQNENNKLKVVVRSDEKATNLKIILKKDETEKESLSIDKVPENQEYFISLDDLEEGTYTAEISSLDKDSDPCVQEQEVVIDKKGPELSLISPKENFTFIEKTTLKIKAEDSLSGIKIIKAYLKNQNKFLASFKKQDSFYSAEINPENIKGKQTLLIKAEDNVGNISTLESIYNFNPLNQQEKEYKEKLSEIEQTLNTIEEQFSEYLKISPSFAKLRPNKSYFLQLKAKLENRNVSSGDLNRAEEYLTQLKNLKKSFLETKGSKVELIIKDPKQRLTEQKIKPKFISKNLLSNTEISKLIEFKTYSILDKVEERATVLYKIKTDLNPNKKYLFFEFFPKNTDISSLSSSTKYFILDPDPIIVFYLDSNNFADNYLYLSYSLKATKEIKESPAKILGNSPLVLEEQTLPKPEDLVDKTNYILPALIIFLILIVASFVVLKLKKSKIAFPIFKKKTKHKKKFAYKKHH